MALSRAIIPSRGAAGGILAGRTGDMAAHTMDGMFWALDAFDPVSVEPVAMADMNGETFPKSGVMKWHFAAKGDRPAFDGYWYEGGLKPQRPRNWNPIARLPETGNLFIAPRRRSWCRVTMATAANHPGREK